jgi:beta-aspartyl-dipeptidase (metallo-type)
MLLIKNAQVYAPEPLGRMDILAAGGRIMAMAEGIDPSRLPCPVELLDAEGLLALPGLIDSHVHILGGGGEGGYATRTPELALSDCIRAGVSTVIGTLGTDGVARSMESLVAKAYGLRAEGISAWIYSGSYRVPPQTVTGDLMKDIMMIEPIIGLGELAISDHRSSHPSRDELARLCSEARVGGLLSGKAGIVNFHLGDAPAGLAPLEELVSGGELPRSQFLPTHCNRNPALFAEAQAWAREGGFVDFTTSTVRRYLDEGEVAASEAVCRLYRAGLIDQVTCSSDGQGSLPLFDEGGRLAGLSMGSSASLWKSLRDAVLGGGIPLEEAAKTLTSTPARALKLGSKGRLAVGADADILLVTRGELEIRGLVAMGRTLMRDGNILVKGNFEERA